MNLVIKRKPASRFDSASGQLLDAPSSANENHLLIVFIQKHDSVAPGELMRRVDEILCNLHRRHTSSQKLARHMGIIVFVLQESNMECETSDTSKFESPVMSAPVSIRALRGGSAIEMRSKIVSAVQPFSKCATEQMSLLVITDTILPSEPRS